MQNFLYPETQRKKGSSNSSEFEFLGQMQKQQTAFKFFMSTLNKCSNRYSPSDLNPEQKSNSKQQILHLKKSLTNKLTQQNFLSSQSKIDTIEKIKNSEESPLINFRITKPKSIQKSKRRNEKHSNVIFKESKVPIINEDSNCNLMKSSHHKITNLKQNYQSSLQKNQNLKQSYLKYSNQNCKIQKQTEGVRINQKESIKLQDKLKIQIINSFCWNPDSNSFLSKLYQEQRQKNSKEQSFFLLQILNMEVQNTIKFLKQQENLILQSKLIQGKDICKFFHKIFELSGIKSLNQPLIKKYNNCFFYGEKPSFDFTHFGVLIYFNGNAYFGSLKNFQKDGIGIEFINSRNSKNQIFKHQLLKGDCEEYYIYRGNFCKNSKIGQFLVNAPNYFYQGPLLKGLFQGKGTLITQSSTFKGIWSMNKKISGIEQFRNQTMVYQGEYLDGEFHGSGKLKKIDELYQGEFKYGQKHGKGILINQGYIYEGMFENNKKQGRGTYFDKIQYRQLKASQTIEEYNFGECIYYVQFRADYMNSKIQIKIQNNQIKAEREVEDLSILQDEKSVRSTLTTDFNNIRPSKLLNCSRKDRIPQKQNNINSSRLHYQKHANIFSVNRSDPDQQQLFGNKLRSNLQGNRTSRSPKKTSNNYI